jgi:PAS domain S-box-containing protein
MSEDYKRILESLRVAVAIMDPAGTIAFANEAMERLCGRARDDLAGRAFGTLFAGGDRMRLQQNVARVGQGKATSAFIDAELAGQAGSWVQIALQPAPDAREGRAGSVIALLQDIAQQRDTELTLNVSAARLLALAESSSAPVMIENARGEVELANEAFCRLLGMESAPQSLTGVAVEDALRDNDARPRLERQPLAVEGAPAGALWIARDDGGEGAIAKAKGAADLALIEKIGVELTGALEGMSAISIRAQQLDVDPSLVQRFQDIRESTMTAMAAIGDLIDFSRVSGGLVLKKSEFALRPTLAELVERIGTGAEERGCRIHFKVEQDVADELEGDVERLLLVLKNLLDNAFAILPGSEVTLQITPEYVTESGIQLSFTVFADLEGEAPRVSADTGMGVAVATFMVAAMGGKLAVATRPTNEALYAFTIEFPVRPNPPAAPRATFMSLVGLPVLVVSDDPAQRLHLTNVLRGWRMVPLEADNAAMALALLERLRHEGSGVPLAIVSNALPVQDGFLLAFRVKHDARFRQTLVMMLATEGKPGDAIACRENGISAYMRYPINDRQLHEAIIAVTGARVDLDAESTATLVTRHSLREQRKGATILLVDPSRDSQILAAHILGRQDCNVVVAQDLFDALSALDQDLYDIVMVDTTLAGLDGDDAPKTLRSHISRDPERAVLVAVTANHSAAYREKKTGIGFDATVQKPFRKDDLLGLLAMLRKTEVEAG